MESVLRYRADDTDVTLSMNITIQSLYYLTKIKLFFQPPHLFKLCELSSGAAHAHVVCSSSRYGLPVNFQAMLLQPNKKTMKKLREVLNELYKHLDSSAAAIIDVSL